MLFKMLGNERAWDMQGVDMPKLRQVFVTQSRVLAGKVQEYFVKLMDSLATAIQSQSELAELAREKKRKAQDEDLLDVDDDVNWRADLPDQFSLLRDEHFPLFITFDRVSKSESANLWPILNCHKLCKLLEADFIHQNAYSASHFYAKDLTTSSLLDHGDSISRRHENGAFVTYRIFLESYWPHFSQALTKGLGMLPLW
jgi:hypothetical protein